MIKNSSCGILQCHNCTDGRDIFLPISFFPPISNFSQFPFHPQYTFLGRVIFRLNYFLSEFLIISNTLIHMA